MKFIVHWTYKDRTTRHDGMKGFMAMTSSDKAFDGGDDIDLIGRWHSANGYEGFLVCETSSTDALTKWLMAWNSVLDVNVTPCLDDDEMQATAKSFFS